jgi:hypothetical protein
MAVQNGVNYDYENCRCGHNGLNHRWGEPDSAYRCTIPTCTCSLFTPLLPAEIQARDEVLRSDPRRFVEIKTGLQTQNDDPEAEFVQGPYRLEIRKTFDRAKPFLAELYQQIPGVDRSLISGVLAEQTITAIKRLGRGREYRQTVLVWKKFCKAWDELSRALIHTITLEQLRDIFKFQKKKGVELNREPEQVWNELYKKWPPWLEDLRQFHDLPMPEAKGKRGRPDMWQIDLQAQKLENHFRELTGSPQREIVGKLLSCAPAIEGVSIDPERIRERKRRRSKQDRHMMQLVATRRVRKN